MSDFTLKNAPKLLQALCDAGVKLFLASGTDEQDVIAEVRRFGMNIGKRSRLVKAGADMIIPDFSQMDKLLKVLKIA